MAGEQLIGTRYSITREIGLRAWENGIEAMLAPSATHPAESNLAVFLDNQRPLGQRATPSSRQGFSSGGSRNDGNVGPFRGGHDCLTSSAVDCEQDFVYCEWEHYAKRTNSLRVNSFGSPFADELFDPNIDRLESPCCCCFIQGSAAE